MRLKKKKEPMNPLDMNIHGGQALMTVSEAMERAEIRHRGFTNLDVDRVSDLGIEWLESDSIEGNWYAKVDGGRVLPLSKQAIKTASKLIDQPNPRHWYQYPDKNAFPKALRHVLDNSSTDGKRKYPKRLLVRHDGLKVRAVLPHTYNIMDGFDMLDRFTDQIGKIGEIKGVSVVDDAEREPGDLVSYRVVVGQNIVPQLEASMGQYMMFLIAVSETGVVFDGGDAGTALGLFRTVCTNSAIRASTLSKWNHRMSGKDKFFGDSFDRIKQIGYYQARYSDIFNQLVQSKFTDVKPRDLLRAMREEKLITEGHYDAAEVMVNEKTEDGRDVSTQYDLFNVLTAAARSLDSVTKRQQAETRSLHLFTEKGGIFERLRNAAEERAREGALRRGIGGVLDADAEAEALAIEAMQE